MTTTGLLLLTAAAVGISIAPCQAMAQATPPAAERAMTVAAVRAVEDHWNRAEMDGEIAYLDQLLLPAYRSVSANGSVHPKAAIIAGAQKQAAHHAAAAAAVDSFRKAHPSRTDITLQGNTAIATFVSLVPASHEAIRGADVFVFTDGAWHALYSAHSSAQ
jgi:hypothetical protein